MADNIERGLHFDYSVDDFENINRYVKEAIELGKGLEYVTSYVDSYINRLEDIGAQRITGHSQEELADYIIRGYKRLVSGLVAYQYHRHGWMTWMDFTNRTPIGGWLTAVFREKQSTILNMSLVWQMCNWLTEHRRLFTPTEALCRRLENVELKGVPADIVALPFRSFAVELPFDVGLPVPDPHGKLFPLRTIYVTDDPEGSTARSSDRTIDDGKRIRRVHVMIVGQWRKQRVYSVPVRSYVAHFDDQIYHWSIPLGAMSTLDTYLDDIEIDKCFQLGNLTTHRPQLVALTRWVLWLLVYLSDVRIRQEKAFHDASAQKAWDKAHRHPKGSKKHKRAVEEAKKLSQQRVIYIGGDVRPPGPGVHTGRKLEVRQYVRGHRKRVPAGPGRVDRKEVVIAPYWRGPEDGEESYSQYMLR